uniref:GpcrRhopsn4 domain-containing protein n=1 Tax=Macrostomum lignano TaxID=282301 RepID=A0A1I8HJ71_9PLAT
ELNQELINHQQKWFHLQAGSSVNHCQKFRIVALSCIASLLLSVSPAVNALHIRGTWDSSRFYLFLAKFGIQKTVLESMAATRGYVYGNVTLAGQRQASSGRQRAPVTLVVVDSEYFQDLYTNSSRQPHNDESCRRMFNKIDRLAWHPQCRQQGKEDFLRSVPCPTGRLCPEEDEPSRVIPGWQLTYAIQDTKQPRYWYLSLFSFDEHDILEIYGVFLMLYAALAGAVHAKLLRRQEPFTWGVAAQCWLEVAGAFLCCVHLAKFAGDGVGASGLWAAGELLRRWADAVFILLLILAARLGLQGRPDPLGTGILLASFL